MTEPEQSIINAVKDYALDRYDNYGYGVYEYHLKQQGLRPEDYADWDIDEHGRIIHTIKDARIAEYDTENDIYYVEIDATPEVADVETYEAYFCDDGGIFVDWHGC